VGRFHHRRPIGLPLNSVECEIGLSDDAIERYIQRYQRMLAVRQHDPQQLAAAYADVDAVILRSMDSNLRKAMKRSMACEYHRNRYAVQHISVRLLLRGPLELG
jgi:hypothetical protein